VANIRHFAKNIFKKEYSVTKSLYFINLFAEKWKKKFKKINTIASSMKGCF
jgi:hypothetical protein